MTSFPDSPTLAFEVILSCRLLLNIRTTHAQTRSHPMNSNSHPSQSNSAPSSNATKVIKLQPNDVKLGEQVGKPEACMSRSFLPGKSEWIDIGRPLKLEPNRYMSPDPHPGKIPVGDHPRREK